MVSSLVARHFFAFGQIWFIMEVGGAQKIITYETLWVALKKLFALD
jgi:hypothetical protein